MCSSCSAPLLVNSATFTCGGKRERSVCVCVCVRADWEGQQVEDGARKEDGRRGLRSRATECERRQEQQPCEHVLQVAYEHVLQVAYEHVLQVACRRAKRSAMTLARGASDRAKRGTRNDGIERASKHR
eukprot:6212459-Pleurochrysis_carterae.AAC.2